MGMLFLSIAHDYFLWHYSRAFKELFHVWLNLLWFVVHFFSIPQLAKSWFAPFKRIVEQKKPGFHFEDIAGYVIINLLSRVVGATLRTILIGIGMLVLLLLIAAGFLIFLSWVFLPIFVVAALTFGVGFLFA